MLYIEGGSTITYQPKRDISNNINTILTFPINDASANFTKIGKKDAILEDGL